MDRLKESVLMPLGQKNMQLGLELTNLTTHSYQNMILIGCTLDMVMSMMFETTQYWRYLLTMATALYHKITSVGRQTRGNKHTVYKMQFLL